MSKPIDLQTLIDLREPPKISFYDNRADLQSPENRPLLLFRELRTEKMREFGWVDLAEGACDVDVYDAPSTQTITAVLHQANGEVRAGLRMTLSASSLEDSLSASMWSKTEQSLIVEGASAAPQIDSRMLDLTRLLLGDEGTADDSIVLFGACFAAMSESLGAYFTVSRSIARYFRRRKMPFEIVHEGEIAGNPCCFALLRPNIERGSSSKKSSILLGHGASLVESSFENALALVNSNLMAG